MPKLELKEMFLWEQSSNHPLKQNDIVLAHVRRLKLCSGKAAEEVLPPMPGLTPSCKMSLLTLPVEPFLLHGRVCLDIKRRASLRFRNALGTRLLIRPEENVKVDPVAVLYDCLKKSHRDGRTKFCVMVATGTVGSGSGHGLPHGRLNVRKNDVPWTVVQQKNRCLNRWTDLCCMFVAWLNEATCDLL